MHDDALLEVLFADSPVGVMVCDVNLRIVQCNERMAEMTNAPREKVIGIDMSTIRGTGVLNAVRAALGGERATYVGPHATTYGEPLRSIVISARTSPLRDADGKIVGAVLMVVDLTALHDAERKQRESEQRYRELVELSPEPIFVHTGGRKFLYANPALLRAFGVASLEELLTKKPSDFVHPDEARGVDQRLNQVTGGQPTTFTGQRFVRADGTAGDAEVASIPLVYEGEQAVLTVARDVSERLKAERASQALERRVRAQFKAIPVPTYAWQKRDSDGDFVLVDFNDPALVITEGQIGKFLGTTLTAMYGAESEIARDIVGCLADGGKRHREFDYTLMTTGRKLRVSLTYVAIPPDLVLAFTEDITERSRLEEELRQAHKMEAIGRLAGGVAHDFNNLLTVIGAFAESVQRSLPAEDSRGAEMAEIVKAAERGASLTRQLLTVSHKQILTRENVVLDDVVLALESMLRRLIGEDIAIVVTAGAGRARVNVDPRQIEQLILNLAVNARDAMSRGGTLTLETALRGEHVFLTVRDTGQGMTEETRKRIFEPFFTTKGPGGGTGLGLATVYGIVQQSGGAIEVTSAVGAGTTFVVRLPRAHVDATEPAARAPSQPVVPSVAAHGTVLLVEDDRAVRKALQRMLERSGYRVTIAVDGAQALEVASTMGGSLDLVVTDVVMPGMSGPEMFAKLSAIRPGLRVLYVSGYNDEEIFRRGTLPPGVTFLQKPFTMDVFLKRVAEVIG